MAWKETDKRLIRRGELILDPSLLENHEKELKTMNRGRRGRPYLLANTYIELLSSIRYLYQMPYRQLEGFTRSLHTLIPALPQGDYSGLRKRILRLNVDPYRSLRETTEPVSIAVDSTGIRWRRRGAGSRGNTGRRSGT